MVDLDRYLEEKQRLVDAALRKIFAGPSPASSVLMKAIRHCLFPGGKRVRPVLAMAASEAVGGRAVDALPVSCALELIHTYSLIHDDLPSMDNDAVRRGKPSAHVAFGEAAAILAGDALLTEAFRVLSDAAPRGRTGPRALEVIREMARAAGLGGMVEGQARDIARDKASLRRSSLERLYLLKTGALIRAAVVCGGRAGGARAWQTSAVARYGDAVGLAYQISDDLLDDGKENDGGYPRLFGRGKALARVRELEAEAYEALGRFGKSADPLRALASHLSARTS